MEFSLTSLLAGASTRPSLMARKNRFARKKPLGEATLTYRYENGLDMWTGEPLTGKDARHWYSIVRNDAGQQKGWEPETNDGEDVETILKVTDATITVRLKNGTEFVATRSRIIRANAQEETDGRLAS